MKTLTFTSNEPLKHNEMLSGVIFADEFAKQTGCESVTVEFEDKPAASILRFIGDEQVEKELTFPKVVTTR